MMCNRQHPNEELRDNILQNGEQLTVAHKEAMMQQTRKVTPYEYSSPQKVQVLLGYIPN